MIEQLAILLTGVTAIWLTQDKRETWRRWACIFGMAAQPFWFWSFWKGQQWGAFLLSFLYAYAWGRGIWNNWIKT